MNKINFTALLDWVLARLEEPSTWAGGGVLSLVILHVFPGALGAAIITLGASIGGFLAVVIPQPNRTSVTNTINAGDDTKVNLPQNSSTTIVTSGNNTPTVK